MTLIEKIAALQQYAHENYEEGGHWAYETMHTKQFRDPVDVGFVDFCYDETNTDEEVNLDKAKEYLRGWWELTNEQESNTRFE